MKTRLPRKALSLFLSLVMMLSLLPTMALADEETYVAKIGETQYATLQDAFNAATDGQTIKLIADSAPVQATFNRSGMTVTLDLNGYTISGVAYDAGNGTYTVGNPIKVTAGTLVIDDTKGGGKITAKEDTTYGSNFCLYLFGGNAVIKNGTLESNSCAVLELGNSLLTVDGGKIIANGTGTQNKYAINNMSASLVINGGEFESNDKALFAQNDKAEVNGGYFKGTVDCKTNKPLKGGYYTTDVSALCATGYECVTNTDTETLEAGYTYKVQEKAVTYVAQIGETPYETLADAIAAAQNDNVIELLSDIVLTENAGVTIPAGLTVTLDLNGKNLSNKLTADGKSQVIDNKGDLTIQDTSEGANGSISTLAAPDSIGNWHSSPRRNWATVAIKNSGTLTVKSGTVVSTAEGGIAYAIDNNSTEGNATLNVEGGTVKTLGAVEAIRMFINSATATNTVNISGGTVTGSGAVWMQGCGSGAVKGVLNVTGGTLDTTTGYRIVGIECDDASIHDNIKVNVSGGQFTMSNSVGGKLGYVFEVDDEGSTPGTFDASQVVLTGGTYHMNAYSNVNTTTWASECLGTLDDLCATGYEVVPNDPSEGLFTVKPKAVTYVAQNVTTGVEYETLQQAITAATSGDTVKLLADINYGSEERQGILIGSPEGSAVNKEITIDLNGKTYEGVFTDGAFIAQRGKLTIKDSSTEKTGVIRNNSNTISVTYAALCAKSRGTIVLESGTVEGYTCGIYQYSVNDSTLGNTTIINGGEVKVAGYAISAFDYDKIEVNGGKVTSTDGYALLNNGSDTADSTITINGGEIYGDAEAIYHPGPGVCTISGGTLTGGETGIEMRAGTLNVTGGTITGNATPTTVTANGNGMTSSGAAIAVAQHTTKLPISVNISGGEINGFSALYESNPQNNSADDIAKVSIGVTGGKFKAINGGTVSVYSADKTGFLKGGYFNEMVNNNYVAFAYQCVPLSNDTENDGYDAKFTELTDEGYHYKIVLRTEKPEDTKFTVTYETEQGQSAPQQTEYHKDASEALEAAKEGTAKATITVESGGITADIDDTVKIVAKTGETNTVTADPGYELNEPEVNANNNTTTYTATALEIGYADKAKTNIGSGKTETKQTDTKTVEAEDVQATEEVKSIAATVTEKTEVETPAVIVNTAKEIAATINQGVAAKALNTLTTATVTNSGENNTTAAKDVSVFVDTYYETQVKDDKTTEETPAEQSFTLDIKPMYQAYATTITVTNETKLENLTIGTDSAPIGEPKELDMTGKNVTMKVKLPAGFVTSINDKVYVKHTKDDGSVHYYTATVEREGDNFFAVFTNPDGFSAFEFSRESRQPVYSGGGVTTYTVSVESAANGKVSVDKKNASSGSTVTITVAPDKGFTLETLTVTDKNGKEVDIKNLGNNKFSFKMPSSKVTVEATFVEAGTCPQDETCVYAKFTDADTKAWYHDGVHFCVENGMMNGVSNTQFAPSGTLTRGMVVTVLARLDGVTITSTGNEWYADGQKWAVANGISDGTNMTANITREQLATMLYRYALLKKVDVDAFTKDTNTLSHNDVFTISDWATSGMHFCIAAGVVGGDDHGNLNPQNNATRAEAAAMFQRFCENVVK